MSESHSGARLVDPLDALRAADHRPAHVVWRERSQQLIERGIPVAARRASQLLLAVVIIGAVSWRLFAASEPPVEESIPLAQAPVSTPVSEQPALQASSDVAPAGLVQAGGDVVVHVAGAVQNPGLVTGPATWRVDDAVTAAGGPTGDAELDRLNLAALIRDGERIFVPTVGEDAPPEVASSSGSTPGVQVGPVNINTADAQALETLPGVGPSTAATIISHREEHGAFGAVDALVAVRGIGPATLDALRDHVTV
jgi:competence protein ComEA